MLSRSLVALIMTRALSSEDVALTSYGSTALAVATFVPSAFISPFGRPRKYSLSSDSSCRNKFARQRRSSLLFFPLVNDGDTTSFALRGMLSSHHPTSVLQSNTDDIDNDVHQNYTDEIDETADDDNYDKEEEAIKDEYDDEDGDDTCYDNEAADAISNTDLVAQLTKNEIALLEINRKIEKSVGVKLEYVSISVQDLFLPFKKNASEEFISLAAFDPIFTETDEFFPSIRKVFVRPTMKRIMKRYTWDRVKMRKRAPRAKSFVLVGSPGTGKSLLFS
jgi:hypothetical protein